MRGTEAVGTNPILDFGIDTASLRYVGHDLQRPDASSLNPTGPCGWRTPAAASSG